MFTFDFFAELSLIGWIGLGLWFVIPILLVATNGDYSKNYWFKDFDDRVPRIEFFTNMFGEWGEAGQITWLILRLVIIQVVLMAIGFIMMGI